MKKKLMAWLVAGGLAVRAAAGDPGTNAAIADPGTNSPAGGSGTNAAVSATVQTKAPVRVVVPLLQLMHLQSASDGRVDRVGRVSSRPWDEVAGRAGAPLFADQREYLGQPGITVLWIGKAPR
jgi:hypothetical protein